LVNNTINTDRPPPRPALADHLADVLARPALSTSPGWPAQVASTRSAHPRTLWHPTHRRSPFGRLLTTAPTPRRLS